MTYHLPAQILLLLLTAIPLHGCAAAAVPVLASAAIATPSRDQPVQQSTSPLSAEPPLATPLPPEFAALIAHVERRAALWREGAPINSLVLDSRQTVLNPVAIGCARREPLVIFDADPAAAPANDSATQAAWRETLASIRASGVGILWVTERFENETAALRPALPGAEPADAIAGRNAPDDRKQAIRQRWAATHCILAVVGDVRADADEAYAYLRDPATPLPIDSHWGAGWFLIPLPSVAIGADQ